MICDADALKHVVFMIYTNIVNIYQQYFMICDADAFKHVLLMIYTNIVNIHVVHLLVCIINCI